MQQYHKKGCARKALSQKKTRLDYKTPIQTTRGEPNIIYILEYQQS